MNYNIYMLAYDGKWIVVPFNKPFATFEETLAELKKLTKKIKNTEWGIHEGADHSKTGNLSGKPDYIHQ